MTQCGFKVFYLDLLQVLVGGYCVEPSLNNDAIVAYKKG